LTINSENEILCEAVKVASVTTLKFILDDLRVDPTAFDNKVLSVVQEISLARLRKVGPLLCKYKVPIIGNLKQVQAELEDLNRYKKYAPQPIQTY
jgi:hypothetical protein